MANREPQDLRTLLLAVQVMEDVDLSPSLVGVRLPGGHEVALHHVRAAARGLVAGDAEDRRQLATWLRTVDRLAGVPRELLRDQSRPVGLPPLHPLHPGEDWPTEALLGGAIDLGIGVLGLDPDRPDHLEVLPATVWDAIGVDPTTVWPRCQRLLEEMGALAARRWELSADGRLLPMGDCDVLTLLGSASLRQVLAGTDGGMRAIVVPMRRRGWTRLSRLDPAFAPAAAMATDPLDRGLLRPLLVTADEVVLAAEGSRIDLSSSDPVVERWIPTATS